MYDIHEIDDISEIEGQKTVWHALLRETADASFFLTPEWLIVYWRHYGARQQLRALVISSNGRAIGIVPLVVRVQHTRAGPMRVLTYPLDYWGSFYGPIGPNPDLLLSAALDYLHGATRDWDLLELRWVPESMDRDAAVEHILRDSGFRASLHEFDTTSLVDLTTTWDGYLASRTSKWRNNFRRWERRLAERGKIEYVRYRPKGAADSEEDPHWDLYDACERVASRSWQSVDNDTPGTTLSHPSIRPFLRDMHETACAIGGVDLNMLFVNGEAVAFVYNYHYSGNLFSLRIGYDPSLASDGAGNLLYAFAIRDSMNRGDRLYDLGPGSLECKKYLWTRQEKLLTYRHYAPLALRSQIVRFKSWITRRATEHSVSRGKHKV